MNGSIKITRKDRQKSVVAKETLFLQIYVLIFKNIFIFEVSKAKNAFRNEGRLYYISFVVLLHFPNLTHYHHVLR